MNFLSTDSGRSNGARVTFVIGFLSQDEGLTDFEAARTGVITIGTFQERFVAPITFWQVRDYQRQWSEGLRRIVSGSEKSCLITALRDPRASKMLFWWPLYREEEDVFVQNSILLFDHLERPFDVRDPYASINERITINEEGQLISEWRVSVHDIEAFLANDPTLTD